MKILLIHNRYAKYSGEEFVYDKIKNILIINNHEILEYTKSSQDIKGVTGLIKAFFTALYNPRSIREIKKLIRIEKPDLAHIHNLYPLISPSILPLLKKNGIPIIMTVHNYRLICPNGLFFTNGSICEKCKKGKEYFCIINNCEKKHLKSLGYALRNYIARKLGYYMNNIDRYLCLTNFQRNKLIEDGFDRNKINILPNSIQIQKINERPINYGGAVTFIGRFSSEKGADILNAVAIKTPDINYVVAGNYDKNSDVYKSSPDNIKYLGYCDKEKLNNLYEEASIIILPSICYEGFPTVILQAMLYSKPVICHDIGGLGEIIINNVNGYLIKLGDIEEFITKIQKLYGNTELQKKMGEKGKQIAAEKYSDEVYYKMLINEYENIL